MSDTINVTVSDTSEVINVSIYDTPHFGAFDGIVTDDELDTYDASTRTRTKQDLAQQDLAIMRNLDRSVSRANTGGRKLEGGFWGDSVAEGWSGSQSLEHGLVYRIIQFFSFAVGLKGKYGKSVPIGAGWYTYPAFSANSVNTYLASIYTSGDGVMNLNNASGFPTAGTAIITIPFVNSQSVSWTGKTGNQLTGVTLAGTWDPSTLPATTLSVVWGSAEVANGFALRQMSLPINGPTKTLTFTGNRVEVYFRNKNSIGSSRIRITIDGTQLFEQATLKSTGTWCTVAGGQEVQIWTSADLGEGSHTIAIDSISGGLPYQAGSVTVDGIYYYTSGDYGKMRLINCAKFATQPVTWTNTYNATTNAGWMSYIRQGLWQWDFLIIEHGSNVGEGSGVLTGQLAVGLQQLKDSWDIGFPGKAYPSIIVLATPACNSKTTSGWDLVRTALYANRGSMALPYCVKDWAELTGPYNAETGDPLGWCGTIRDPGVGSVHPDDAGHKAIGDYLGQNIVGPIGVLPGFRSLQASIDAFASSSVADGAVTTVKLADGSVTTAKMVDANVTAAKLAADAVTTVKILDANVTTAKLADGSVTAAKHATDSVTTVKILDANVTAAKLASDSVITVKILDANVTAAKIATDAVTTIKIQDGAVTAAKHATDSVTTVKILDANVTASKLATDSVTTAKILADNVTLAKIDSTLGRRGPHWEDIPTGYIWSSWNRRKSLNTAAVAGATQKEWYSLEHADYDIPVNKLALVLTTLPTSVTVACMAVLDVNKLTKAVSANTAVPGSLGIWNFDMATGAGYVIPRGTDFYIYHQITYTGTQAQFAAFAGSTTLVTNLGPIIAGTVAGTTSTIPTVGTTTIGAYAAGSPTDLYYLIG